MNKSGQMTELLMTFLKDKQEVTEKVLENLQQSSTIRRGLDNMVEQLIDESNELNFRKTALVLVRSMRKLAAASEQNGVLALLYVAEGDFDVNSVMMLNRLGKGQEALQQMWKNKMGAS